MASRTKLLLCTFGAAFSATAHAASPVSLLATNTANIFSYPEPPPGFDAFTASQSDLAAYGFPPRPGFGHGNAARRQWEALAKSARTRIQPILQATTIVNGPAMRSGRPLEPNAQGATQYSKNWSGQVLLNNSTGYGTGAFTAVAGTFNLPVASQAFGACTGGWDYLSTWVGIDGWTPDGVFQAGAESDAYCANAAPQPYYTAWVEWYPANETRITNLPVSPGDVLLVWMIGKSATTGEAIIINETTGQSVFMNLTAPLGTTLQGNSAEWIMERPKVNNALATMSNYVEAWMSDENAALGNSQSGNFGVPPAGATPFLVIMDDNNGAAISYATPVGANAAVFKDEGSAK